MTAHLNIKIHGQVQGVTFRFFAKQQADSLSITGFVQNQPDGTVYLEAEGEEKDLNQFLAWCKKGPSFATVTKVELTYGELKNFNQFSIS